MNQPISHSHCDHASSKAARAKCRRSRSKFDDLFAEALTVETADRELEGPELTAAYDRLIDAADDLVESMKFFPEAVTSEDWREYKSTQVRIATQIDDNTQNEIATGAYITGWGKQWVNYTVNGTNKRAAVTCIRVETVEPKK